MCVCVCACVCVRVCVSVCVCVCVRIKSDSRKEISKCNEPSSVPSDEVLVNDYHGIQTL